MSPGEPNRGDVWSINLDPNFGRKRAGTRRSLCMPRVQPINDRFAVMMKEGQLA
jgi:mRNA-degrading endonuclease toxin of MazEF toxin-antitoxin module